METAFEEQMPKISRSRSEFKGASSCRLLTDLFFFCFSFFPTVIQPFVNLLVKTLTPSTSWVSTLVLSSTSRSYRCQARVICARWRCQSRHPTNTTTRDEERSRWKHWTKGGNRWTRIRRSHNYQSPFHKRQLGSPWAISISQVSAITATATIA